MEHVQEINVLHTFTHMEMVNWHMVGNARAGGGRSVLPAARDNSENRVFLTLSLSTVFFFVLRVNTSFT